MSDLILVVAIFVFLVVGVFVGGVYFFSNKKRKEQNKLYQDIMESVTAEKSGRANVQTSAPKSSHAMMSLVKKMDIETYAGDKLTLASVEKRSNLRKKKFQEITVRGNAIGGGLVQGVMPALGQAHTLSKITKSATNGLFTATAPLAELMKYKDGTIGSIVMNNGKVLNHSGFKEVALRTSQLANPAIAVAVGMQAMAMISGQYYMHNISKQLEGIARGIEKLIGFHHDQNLGKLRSIENMIKGIVDKQYVDDADIIALQSGVRDADSILIEYSLRLEKLSKTGEITEIKVRKFWSRLSPAKELQNLSENANEHELFYSIRICLFASKLMVEGKKAEFATRMKMGDTDKAVEAFSSFREAYTQSFINNAPSFLDSIYSPINAKAKSLIQNQLFKSKRSSEVHSAMESKKADLDVLISQMSRKENDEYVISSFYKNRDILYIPATIDSEQRMFVSVE